MFFTSELSLPLFDIEIDSEIIDLFWQALEKQTHIFEKFIEQTFEYSEIVKMLSCSKPERFYWLYALVEKKIEAHFSKLDIIHLIYGFIQIGNNINTPVFFQSIEPLCFSRIQKESAGPAFKLFYHFFKFCDFDSLQSLLLKK